jgi:hypothetical protein
MYIIKAQKHTNQTHPIYIRIPLLRLLASSHLITFMTPAELQWVTCINLKVGNHVIIEYSAIVGNLDIIGYSSE